MKALAVVTAILLGALLAVAQEIMRSYGSSVAASVGLGLRGDPCMGPRADNPAISDEASSGESRKPDDHICRSPGMELQRR